MRLKGTDLTVYTGEQFTLDFIVRNEDGTPYVIPSQYTDPYILLTVTSSNYQQVGRYRREMWLSCKNYPKFFDTSIGELASETLIDGIPVATAYRLYKIGTEYKYIVLTWNEKDVITKFIDAKTCEHYYIDNGKEILITDEKGEQIEPTIGKNGWGYKFVPYEGFRIIVAFTSVITSKWVAQSYKYNMLLVTNRGDYCDTTGDVPYEDYNIESVLIDNSKISVLSAFTDTTEKVLVLEIPGIQEPVTYIVSDYDKVKIINKEDK